MRLVHKANYVDLTADDVFLHLAPLLTPLAFDATVTSLFLPLLSGKQVLLLPEERQLEILASDDADAGFSLLKLTPAQVNILNELAATERFNALTKTLRPLRGCGSFWPAAMCSPFRMCVV